jgi:uncharacterized protein (DUF1330 family)
VKARLKARRGQAVIIEGKFIWLNRTFSIISAVNQKQGEPMKTNYKIAIALVAGTALGAAVVQGLHAQAKPPAFVVAEIGISNQEAFLKEYTPLAVKALTDSGNKALARGGKTVSIEGAPPKSRIVINSFANLDAAVAAYNSPAYKEARKIGNKYGMFRLYAVEGLTQ